MKGYLFKNKCDLFLRLNIYCYLGGMNFQNTRPQDPRMAPHDPRLMNPQHNRGGGPPHGIRPMNGQSGRGMPRR